MEAQAVALVMGAGGLAVAARVLWCAGARQRRQHGWPWWVATLAVSAVAWPLCTWATLHPSTAGSILAAAWLLGWPMSWLAGWRRFHARQRLPGQGWLDAAAWALATLAALWWPWQAAVLLHVYVAAVLWVGRLRTADRGLGWTAVAVAVAASCAFLTPIGHKNNMLILGPGQYRFGDYWRMGLPLEVLVIATGLPAILFFWPL